MERNELCSECRKCSCRQNGIYEEDRLRTFKRDIERQMSRQLERQVDVLKSVFKKRKRSRSRRQSPRKETKTIKHESPTTPIVDPKEPTEPTESAKRKCRESPHPNTQQAENPDDEPVDYEPYDITSPKV